MCVVFPPFAVADRGCGTLTIMLFLTVIFWPLAIVAAFYLNLRHPISPKYVTIPTWDRQPERDREYIRLADGTMAEVVENGDFVQDDLAEKYKRLHNDED